MHDLESLHFSKRYVGSGTALQYSVFFCAIGCHIKDLTFSDIQGLFDTGLS